MIDVYLYMMWGEGERDNAESPCETCPEDYDMCIETGLCLEYEEWRNG